MMKAWTVKEAGSLDQLVMEDRPVPTVDAGEALVKVNSFGINRLELMQRQTMEKQDGHYPILGVEFAGEVVDKQSNRTDLEVGSRVMGIVKSGSHAEYVTVPADRLMLIPDDMTDIEAAALPEAWLTAYQVTYWLGQLQNGETIFIHAAASGVGTAALQMAQVLSDAKVIGSSSKDFKLEALKDMGCDLVLNYKEDDMLQAVEEMTDGKGADIILDFIGASNWQLNLDLAAVDGRWIIIGNLGGVEVPSFNLWDILAKRLTIQGTLLSPRSQDYKARLSQEFSDRVLPHFETGELKPIIDRVLNFDQLPQAHQVMENNENMGKIIMTIDE